MKLLQKHKWLLLLGDVLAVPAAILCRLLTQHMLLADKPCPWTLFGGQCVTCGGTHFVNTLCSGQLGEAFFHNQFLFALTVLALGCWILLHLWLFCKLQPAKKVLYGICSIPGLITVLSVMFLFLLWRNIPVFVRIGQLLF